ncbi:MAG: DUF4881 domain-containing protein [Desulfomicrobium sp.]|nr:DUF4881 domain-containing protein [Pseudomonadota bacterium]MBV1711486.1 DUF4881 domain-containing protein [Desulfomicrobium sp.]MBU4570889.1 DUF4881 domain-containing protein [Pseudomonadota bacterium]MBU4595379.1 DUF4881 domain-containing protein [Pseudomonadota bacterium]MBV1720810.1 DUF4881 domain-containing protein [Desulfomicrobium sp.]
MNIKRTLFMLMVAVLTFGVLGCDEYGKVDQGRVIAFDMDKQTVTVIEDKNMDSQNPDYAILPPHTYTMPTDPAERGADPKVGLRMKIDVDAKIIKIFNPSTQVIEDLPITIVDAQKDIAKDHPLVFDKGENKAKKFPVVDKDKKAITIYSGRQKLLVTFSVPEEYFNFPEYTWDAGDEVRIYWKEKGKAIRFMNISKTDIFKK